MQLSMMSTCVTVTCPAGQLEGICVCLRFSRWQPRGYPDFGQGVNGPKDQPSDLQRTPCLQGAAKYSIMHPCTTPRERTCTDTHTLTCQVAAAVEACALGNDCRQLLAAAGKGFVFRYEHNPRYNVKQVKSIC